LTRWTLNRGPDIRPIFLRQEPAVQVVQAYLPKALGNPRPGGRGALCPKGSRVSRLAGRPRWQEKNTTHDNQNSVTTPMATPRRTQAGADRVESVLRGDGRAGGDLFEANGPHGGLGRCEGRWENVCASIARGGFGHVVDTFRFQRWGCCGVKGLNPLISHLLGKPGSSIRGQHAITWARHPIDGGPYDRLIWSAQV